MLVRKAFIVGSVIFLSSTALVSAETSSNSGMYRKAIMEDRAELREKIKNARQEMKAKFQSEHEALKAKIASLKDERKKTTADKVTTRFTTINTNQTEHMTKSLERLNTILDKLSSQAAEAKTAGKNTAAVDTAITSAKTALATAQTAVTTQAGKQYIPQITDDATLRQNINTTFLQLQTDLQTTRKTVQLAKEAVLTVAKELAKLNTTTQ